MQYLVKVTSAAKACELDVLGNWQVFAYDSDDFDYRFLLFRSEVDHYLNVIKIKNTRRTNANGVRLNDQEKQTLHGYIEKMRQIIASSNLPDPRKERIYEVLGQLGLEVSRDRTRFERVATFTRNLAGLSKETANEGAMPWAKVFLAFWGCSTMPSRTSSSGYRRRKTARRCLRRTSPRPSRSLRTKYPSRGFCRVDPEPSRA